MTNRFAISRNDEREWCIYDNTTGESINGFDTDKGARYYMTHYMHVDYELVKQVFDEYFASNPGSENESVYALRFRAYHGEA